MTSRAIDPADIIPMDVFADEGFRIDLVYANADHPENIFNTAIYAADARLSLHRDFAGIVILAARLLQDRHGWTLILKDGLRTIEAQQKLMETDIVRANPHWLVEPRLLSLPGQGAHPRGMAIDVSVADINMGTVFDAMVPESARDYQGFDADILENRRRLESAFRDAADALSRPILPLPSEWWDFRFPLRHYSELEPLFDADLPPSLRMTRPAGEPERETAFEGLAKDILRSL